MNPKVDAFLARAEQWKEEFEELRKLALASGLTEDVKWGVPCYTHEGHNVVLIHGFKEYCALLFFQGALLADPDAILVQQTANVQAARQIRFTSVDEIRKRKASVKGCIKAAIAVEKAGLKVAFKQKEDLQFPEEFAKMLTTQPHLKKAFEALTPGRQRAYNLYFSAPKQSKTRRSRVEKSIPQILEGKGLHD